ncbi:MAG TPA: cytidylate kinase family protein [Chloroflexota bacterium]|nr:cytidylate kinase family protein [Chloroflexota bacterium]
MAIITISRGTFGGGEALAEALASRLGYECVSREALVESATWYGVPAGSPGDAENRAGSLERLASERKAHLVSVRAALCDRARGGNLVYHGHAGHLLWGEDVSHVIRLRVVADMEYRIRAAMKRHSLGREGAIAYIEKVDRERSEWTNFLYGVAWEDPSLYDMVLNLARISIPSACEIVAQLTQLPEFRPTPRSMKAMEDIALSSRVLAHLLRDPRTAGLDLKVTADDGRVTINCAAQPRDAQDAIPIVAAQVEGVKQIDCSPVPTVGSSPQ